ncbi:MAG: IS5 family transposase [Helicobacteraceae bacterium]|nr:IS5 family transposase [Candidatus Sulfurimonas ponti]
MLKNSSSKKQLNLFQSPLSNILDMNDPLIALADTIDWKIFEEKFEKYYSKDGRPAKPIRLMVGILLLKQLENLSDESVVLQWKRNPYYQYFCGLDELQIIEPCHPTDLVYFRKRISTEGMKVIFAMSVSLHGKDVQEKQVIIDTTVQENNITYPTDGKLAIKIINHLHKIAKVESIQMRRTYMKEIKGHRISLRFFRHPRKIKKARSAMKRLKTIAKTLIRDLDRNFTQEQQEKYAEKFYLYMRILLQEKGSKNKIYSLHESHAYAVGKGKDHKKWEYGTKASLVTTKKSGIIIGVASHKKNEHDSKTLEAALTSANSNRTKLIKEAICDRGYVGKKEVLNTKISLPGVPLKRDTKYQKEQKREKFRRRAAIEPIIGHVKSDHRMKINYLKGFIGDEINLLLAASAFNLKKWMNNFIQFIILLKLLMLTTALLQQKQEDRHKYDKLFLLLFRLW